MNLNPFSLFAEKGLPSSVKGAVAYGDFKKDGSHDHRSNKGPDRTPAQKSGDLKRTKNDE